QLRKFLTATSTCARACVMAGEEAKKAVPAAAAPEATAEKDVPVVIPPPPGAKPPADDSKALLVVDSKVAEKPHPEKNIHRGSHERDVALAKVETEKMSSLIKAWVENEKAKAENKAAKKLSSILSWENTKKATIDAQLKRKE
uniref:Remorin N-terminal domain-containing protein n=1 Tax=Aegilops tauschii subsp. strangulata TaxID=200361 RepID=A0A453P5Z9_AEGTS